MTMCKKKEEANFLPASDSMHLLYKRDTCKTKVMEQHIPGHLLFLSYMRGVGKLEVQNKYSKCRASYLDPSNVCFVPQHVYYVRERLSFYHMAPISCSGLIKFLASPTDPHSQNTAYLVTIRKTCICYLHVHVNGTHIPTW